MIEKRFYNFKKKVFRKEDIIRIGRLIDTEADRARAAGETCECFFHVICLGDTSFQADSVAELLDTGVLDSNVTINVHCCLTCFTSRRQLCFQATYAGLHENRLKVTGEDALWVSGVFARVRESIDNVQGQENWILSHRTASLHLMAVVLGALLQYSGYLLVRTYLAVTGGTLGISVDWSDQVNLFFATAPWAFYLWLAINCWLAGLGVAFLLRNWLLRLWPDVEFDFGPQHLRLEKRRKTVTIVLSLIVVPLIVDLAVAFMAR